MQSGQDDSVIGEPRRQRKRQSYDENVDEPAKLIEAEPTDIEHEAPAAENESIQQVKDTAADEPPVFEE